MKYTITTELPDHSASSREVYGWPVKLAHFPNMEFFAFFELGHWHVTELRTGLAVLHYRPIYDPACRPDSTKHLPEVAEAADATMVAQCRAKQWPPESWEECMIDLVATRLI